MTTTRDRRGFTLTELIVVTVLGALVVAASMQILITNQRTYTAQNAQIQGQQATRAALDLLSAEIREISPAGGDLITMGKTSMSVRVMRKLGIACAVSLGSSPTLRVLKIGDWFDDHDSVFVFADNDEDWGSDDAWITAHVTDVDTTKVCGADKAVDLDFDGQGSRFAADSVRVGATVRSFLHYTYALTQIGDEYYLTRQARGGSAIPMVGPLKAGTGLEFVYLDQNGDKTSTKTEVRQIAVKIRTSSGVVNSVGTTVSDSIAAWVYTRN
ncbi:MAG TPA: prepilin-type N-terminal cleavage/methylation domain-containing protein [Longimicrobiales bacterium]|nr:prepilin-type N-terminal cleavage/methylation domain-containing protein [Longimicrobiales bacterium]